MGNKNIRNTLIYIDLENAIFQAQNDEFTVRVAKTVEEACQLIEVGFEYVTGEYSDGGKVFPKTKMKKVREISVKLGLRLFPLQLM